MSKPHQTESLAADAAEADIRASEVKGVTNVKWVPAVIRVLLAAVFVLYGVLKLLGLQLTTGDMSELPFGKASPLQVTWYFFNLSPLYRYAIAAAQIGTGLLLLVPRTAAVGALCFFVIIVNIVLINFGYDIALDVKILSSVLLALDCWLIGHYWRRYRLLVLPDAALDRLLGPKFKAARD